MKRRVLLCAALACVAQPALAQAVRNAEAPPKSLVKVLVVWVLGYDDGPSPMRVVPDKPIENMGKGVEVAVNNATSGKKRVALQP